MTKTKKGALIALAECAVMVGLATALSFIKVFELPLGGAVTLLSMLPVMFLSFRHRPVYAFGSAFVYSLIQLWQGSGVFAYVPTGTGIAACILLDYIVPFTLLGIAGIFYRENASYRQKVLRAAAGVGLALVLRFACHLISGAVVWYELTKTEGWNEYALKAGMWTYSFVYNISFFGPESALVLAAIPVVPKLEEALKKAGI